MTFDFKKEYKELYLPKTTPSIVNVSKINYLAYRGSGNPNEANGEYQKSIEALYTIAYTIRMSYKSSYQIKGFFEYVVPPLEGFWWIEGLKGMDIHRKNELNFISIIRLPDFVTKEVFDWAIKTATQKKKKDFSKVVYFTYDEGLCVQCMHIGSFDEEYKTVELMHKYANERGYKVAISDDLFHHEIYLSDPRKSEVSKLRTVIRHPIKKQI